MVDEEVLEALVEVIVYHLFLQGLQGLLLLPAIPELRPFPQTSQQASLGMFISLVLLEQVLVESLVSLFQFILLSMQSEQSFGA